MIPSYGRMQYYANFYEIACSCFIAWALGTPHTKPLALKRWVNRIRFLCWPLLKIIKALLEDNVLRLLHRKYLLSAGRREYVGLNFDAHERFLAIFPLLASLLDTTSTVTPALGTLDFLCILYWPDSIMTLLARDGMPTEGYGEAASVGQGFPWWSSIFSLYS